jgi:hypothetical protein
MLRDSYWLWPLPKDGTLRLFCEWPIAAIGLTSVEAESRSLREAAATVVRIWPDDQDGAAPAIEASSSNTFSLMRPRANRDESSTNRDATISAAQVQTVRKALLRAVEVLDQL